MQPIYGTCDLCGIPYLWDRLAAHRGSRECQIWQRRRELFAQGWEPLDEATGVVFREILWRALPQSCRRVEHLYTPHSLAHGYGDRRLLGAPERWVTSPLPPIACHTLIAYADRYLTRRKYVGQATVSTHIQEAASILQATIRRGQTHPDEVRAAIALWQLQEMQNAPHEED